MLNKCQDSTVSWKDDVAFVTVSHRTVFHVYGHWEKKFVSLYSYQVFCLLFFPFLCIIKMLHYVVRKTWKKLHLLVTSSLDRIYNTCIYLRPIILHNVIHLVSIRFLCLYSYIFVRYNCIFYSILPMFSFLRFMDILETTQI